MSTFQAIRKIWRRYFAVYRKNIRFGLVTTFVEPLLYMFSFGLGVGGLVGELQIDGVALSYRRFVFAGIMGQAVLFQGFFDAAYGSFVRMYYQKIFQAMAVTPITISEILWGELLWDASRATLSAAAICLIGVLAGDFSPLGALLVIPIAFAAALIFAGMGLFASAKSASIDEISYPQFLVVFPMFLFCGVFFPLGQMPPFLQGVAWLLPLTPVLDIFRAFTLGLPWHWWSPILLVLWMTLFLRISRQAMISRLVK